MSSNLDNDFSLLIAELLRNELLSQSRSTRRTARRQRHHTPATTTPDTTTPDTTTPDTTRRRLMDVITEYNGIIGHYNRNMEMLFGLLNDEMTHNRNTETSPPGIYTLSSNDTPPSRNSTSPRHTRRHTNTIHR